MCGLGDLRLSRFVHFIRLGECTAIYNAMNMAVLFLGNETAGKIQEGNWSPESERDKELVKKAAEEGILVALNNDDLSDYREIQGQLSTLPISILYLLTTDQCNFACRYCFIEGSFPVGHVASQMTPEVAKKGVDLYAQAIVRNPSSKRKRVIFYGGEPLLNFTTMVAAVEYIEELKSNGSLPKEVGLSLNTNASVVTSEIAQFLAGHQITASVSLDGRKIAHNRERIFHSGEGTFDTTLRGFMLLKKYGVNVGVSCTIAESGVDNVEDTIAFITDELGIRSFGFNILRETQASRLTDPEGYAHKVSNALIRAFKIARDRGVYEDRMMRKVRCFIKRQPYLNDCAGCGSEIAVSPDGLVGVCHGAVGLKHYFVPLTPEVDPLKHPYWSEWRTRSPFNMPECIDCVALGICGGGCPYEALLKEGTIWNLDRRFCVHAKATLEFLIQDLWRQTKTKTE